MTDQQQNAAPTGAVSGGATSGRPVSAQPAALANTQPGGPLVPPSSANPTVPPPVPSRAAASSAMSQPQTAAPSPVSPEEPAADIELPPLRTEATAFMTSQYYRDSENGLIRDFGLTADDLSFLNEMDHMVLGMALPVAGYIRGLRGEFPGLPNDRREQLIGRLVAERLLPWNDVLKPAAETAARTEKLALPKVSYYAVYLKPLTYGAAAGEIARMADIPVGGQTRERLRDLLTSRVKEIRLDAQVEEQLMRPSGMGGLALEPEKARAVVIAMNDVAGRAKLVTEDEYSAWLADEARAKQQAARATTPALARPADDEDEKEIAAIVAKMPKPVRDTSSVLALSTETLLGRLSLKPPDEYAQRRLRDIVSTRLRDIRSKSEVMLRLSRETKVGGLGLERKEAERIAGEIEEGYNEFHGLIVDEEKGKRETQAVEQARKVEERKKREAEEHARWFEEKVRGKRLEDESKQQMVQRMRTVAQGYTNPIVLSHPVDVKDKVREEAALGELVHTTSVPPPSTPSRPAVPVLPTRSASMEPPVVPPVRPRVPAPAVSPSAGADSAIPSVNAADAAAATFFGKSPAPSAAPQSAPVPAPVVPPPAPTPTPAPPRETPVAPERVPLTFIQPSERPSMPSPPMVKVSTETAKMNAAEMGLRPRMDDVKMPRTHLAGPLQELEDLNLASFRRLGKTPEEAVARIKRNLDLLAQESFEQKIEGIQAWQTSPLQKTYLTLVAEAFSTATPVNALVDRKKAAGEDTLSSAELMAIVDLNGSLQM